jgi:hypothetical protein
MNLKRFIILLNIILIASGLSLYGQNAFVPSETINIELEQHQANNAVGRNLKATVGDTSETFFKPSLKLEAWDGLCRFEVYLPTDSNETINDVFTGMTNLSLSIHFSQGKDFRHSIYKRSDGNLEWEIRLSGRPVGNRITFRIDSENLLFYYQPLLSPDDNFSVRPDSVIGSYAVYYAFRRNNYKIVTDKDITQFLFGTGKAFHIYRPRLYDANGDTIWGELRIDTTCNEMSITAPASFLEKAVYPVIIDPTFGTTSVGGTSYLLNSNNIRHCRYTMGTTDGTVDSLAIYIAEDGGGVDIGGAIYDDIAGCNSLIDSSTAQASVAAYNSGWLFLESAERPILSAATDYWFSVVASASTYLKYDNNNSDTSTGYWSDAWPFDSGCNSGWNANNYTYSIYAVYTVAEEEGSIQCRRRKIILENNK